MDHIKALTGPIAVTADIGRRMRRKSWLKSTPSETASMLYLQIRLSMADTPDKLHRLLSAYSRHADDNLLLAIGDELKLRIEDLGNEIEAAMNDKIHDYDDGDSEDQIIARDKQLKVLKSDLGSYTQAKLRLRSIKDNRELQIFFDNLG